ncbi:MAG TPA: hypothetical protein VFV85_01750 [Conexibacter sp.]|nr:hypothetical protein [Conexibacter sp.]
MRIFFATDLHGSDLCFRKFCEAADFYECDALIMGGDVTGKLLVPIVVEDGTAAYTLGGAPVSAPVGELDTHVKRIANMGYYAAEVPREEAEALRDGLAYEARLLQEAVARAHRWTEYAQQRLGASGLKIHFAPGNDDEHGIDAAFSESPMFVNCEGRAVELGDVTLATCGWSNPTPWHTARECSEEDLGQRLRRVVDQVDDMDRAIFNLHVPPHGTPLDLCPELDDDFNVVTVMGNPVMAHAGSTAVREVIEQCQPLVGLHGHIHESRNTTKLGRTLVVNPGSEYGEGVLLGAIVTVKRGKVRHTFTAG